MDENKKLEFRGSSFMALVPFAIFIVLQLHYHSLMQLIQT